jgi:hypothetical protein
LSLWTGREGGPRLPVRNLRVGRIVSQRIYRAGRPYRVGVRITLVICVATLESRIESRIDTFVSGHDAPLFLFPS